MSWYHRRNASREAWSGAGDDKSMGMIVVDRELVVFFMMETPGVSNIVSASMVRGMVQP
jgi:hypothetical protein